MSASADIAISISYANASSGLSIPRALSDTVSISGLDSGILNLQNIGTVDETLDLGDVASNGYFFAVNRDPTNFISIGYTSGTYFAKLKAGEGMIMRAGAGLTAFHAKADTAACDLEYFLLPD